MKLYKLKHLPTGLFFTPSKGSGNLSSKGKIYINRKPELKWVESIRIVFYPNPVSKSQKNKKLLEFFQIDVNKWRIDECFKTNPEDWEIIEIGHD